MGKKEEESSEVRGIDGDSDAGANHYKDRSTLALGLEKQVSKIIA